MLPGPSVLAEVPNIQVGRVSVQRDKDFEQRRAQEVDGGDGAPIRKLLGRALMLVERALPSVLKVAVGDAELLEERAIAIVVASEVDADLLGRC